MNINSVIKCYNNDSGYSICWNNKTPTLPDDFVDKLIPMTTANVYGANIVCRCSIINETQLLFFTYSRWRLHDDSGKSYDSSLWHGLLFSQIDKNTDIRTIADSVISVFYCQKQHYAMLSTILLELYKSGTIDDVRRIIRNLSDDSNLHKIDINTLKSINVIAKQLVDKYRKNKQGMRFYVEPPYDDSIGIITSIIIQQYEPGIRHIAYGAISHPDKYILITTSENVQNHIDYNLSQQLYGNERMSLHKAQQIQNKHVRTKKLYKTNIIRFYNYSLLTTTAIILTMSILWYYKHKLQYDINRYVDNDKRLFLNNRDDTNNERLKQQIIELQAINTQMNNKLKKQEHEINQKLTIIHEKRRSEYINNDKLIQTIKQLQTNNDKSHDDYQKFLNKQIELMKSTTNNKNSTNTKIYQRQTYKINDNYVKQKKAIEQLTNIVNSSNVKNTQNNTGQL